MLLFQSGHQIMIFFQSGPQIMLVFHLGPQITLFFPVRAPNHVSFPVRAPNNAFFSSQGPKPCFFPVKGCMEMSGSHPLPCLPSRQDTVCSTPKRNITLIVNIIIIITALISTVKGEHNTFYMINKNGYIKP